MITENKIQCFLEVCLHLNFTKASEALYMTRQAVSKQVSELERDLGLRLFDRTTNRVELTEAGTVFRSFFIQTRDEFEVVAQRARRIAAGNTAACIGCLADLEERMTAPTGDSSKSSAQNGLRQCCGL